MVEKRTVFVLGAGASCPYGFPTARELRRNILDHMPALYGQHVCGFGTEYAWTRIQQGYPDESAMKRFLESFDLSSTESIDLFLSRNPKFVTIGKMAISLRILEAEKCSRFRESVPRPGRDWYFYLYNRMTRELLGQDGYSGFPRDSIAFVTFNYDRSFEHFLFNSILHSFEGVENARVRELLSHIPIIHLYGQVGDSYLQETETKVAYGAETAGFSSIDLLKVIEGLRVVHEERDDVRLHEARDEISKAERVFFLGFGYAKENLEALGFPDVAKRSHRIYGTAMGWTPKEIEGIRSDFIHAIQRSGDSAAGVGDQVQIRDCDCVALLREFL